ncbi:DUF58 domain-containing protein [Azonexus sp.]|jgi:uncharacterized protein (DUF58 family)|uniref:DUF58 domain-containing protein n=1 Tax=Azonexus sp. TaxID=1872668 RepID=UPI00282C891E|nr:DUF58 domain-containing protein [Azonexus sp.]MDR1995571.1 DUF58 domain-containing protein [Azonexus sp.]
MALLATLRQRLFRWQSDGTAPTRLGQRRVFILPTGAGLLFAIALVVMLIGAINYTLALGHALVFLLAGIALNGMVHTFRNLHGLVIAPGRCEPVFAGEIAHFPLRLGNERSSPRLGLELEAAPGAGATHADIAGNEMLRVSLPLPAERRGWLTLPRVRLWTRYPLGLFRAWSYLQPEMRCLVYPAPLASPLPPVVPTLRGGEHGSDGGEEDFAGFRLRQPADSPRHVAWKASARAPSRPLLVKQFAGGAQVELRLDWDLTNSALPAETRLSLLTGWVLAADALGACYALRLPGSDIPAGAGEQHRRRCLETLALATL